MGKKSEQTMQEVIHVAQAAIFVYSAIVAIRGLNQITKEIAMFIDRKTPVKYKSQYAIDEIFAALVEDLDEQY